MYSDAFFTAKHSARELSNVENNLLDAGVEQLKEWLTLTKARVESQKKSALAIDQFLSCLPGEGTTATTTLTNETALELFQGVLEYLNSASLRFHNQLRPCIQNQGGFNYRQDSSGGRAASGRRVFNRGDIIQHDQVAKCMELFYHPEQVAMVIQDIEDLYRAGTRESLDRCNAKIHALTDRLAPFRGLKKTDPLYLSYKANEEARLLVPSTPAIEPPYSITSIVKSLDLAERYADRLSKGLDFYGLTPDWAPQASFKFYMVMLDKHIRDFSTIETDFKAWQQDALEATKAKEWISSSEMAARIRKGNTEERCKALVDDRKATAITIADLSKEVSSQFQPLLDKIKNVETKIATAENKPLPTKIFESLTQVAFAPNKFMVGLQIASMGYNSITKIADDKGVEVNRKYLIKQVTSHVYAEADTALKRSSR